MSDALPAIDWSRGVPLMAGPYFLGLYQPSPETKDFWDGVAQHELRLKWCPHCAKAHHPKRIVCTFCGNTELGTHRACGRGTVYSFSEVHRAPIAGIRRRRSPYTVGVVRLEEGVHLFTPADSRPAADARDRCAGAGRFPRARARQSAAGFVVETT